MSEGQVATDLEHTKASAQHTAGALLREAREAAGLHIAAMAVSLKVPVRKLEALEADQYDQLPDAVFTRALAASVCRALKVDAAPILERLPQTAAPRLDHETSAINAPFRTPAEVAGQSWVDQLTRPVFLAVFALLLGALVLILLPSVQRDAVEQVQAVVTPTPAAEPSAAPVVAPAVPVSPGEASTAAPSTALPASAPVAAPAASSAAAVRSTNTTAAAPAASAAAPVAAEATKPVTLPEAAGVIPAKAVVVFRTSGESWVEVTDAKGVVTLRRTLTAGEAAGATGALPLSVVVGRADVTAVLVRGKPLDVVPLARDNVARFEVK